MTTFKPGDKVVIYRAKRYTDSGAHIVEDVVDRVLKRDIVTVGGERFNKDRPTRSNGTWDPPTELLHADDPRVQRAKQVNAEARRVHLLSSGLGTIDQELRRTRDVDGAINAIRALMEALA